MMENGYEACYKEMVDALLPEPHKYQSFIEFFNIEKIDKIIDTYGIELYRQCRKDILNKIGQA